MHELQHTVKSAVSMGRPGGLSLNAALAQLRNRAEKVIDVHSKRPSACRRGPIDFAILSSMNNSRERPKLTCQASIGEGSS